MLQGKKIKITGRIEFYHGKPEMSFLVVPSIRMPTVPRLAPRVRLRSFNLEDCRHVNASPLAHIVPDDHRL
jgi:hypothetical protein